MNDAFQNYQEILNRTTLAAVQQTWAVLNAPATINPVLSYARLIDLVRANALLWAEAELQMKERTVRGVPAGRAISRPLVLATVATDIFLGYFTLYERAKWVPSSAEPRDWHWQHERGANRVLETAAALGGALIKACQFASTRPDLLPASYIRALAPLQDRMPARPWLEIQQAIETELERPVDAVFAEIEHEPIAAASISQVHYARLHNGREVAVKVQYPDVRDLVATDLRVLDLLAKGIAQISSSIQLQPIVDYLKETLPLELDFAHEAEATTELRAALAHRSDVVVPEVVPEFSTPRLIVMDYAPGIKITDREALEKAGIDLQAVAKLLNEVYAEQMLRAAVLHGDPHPGNLLVQPGPRLVLLDHGLTVKLKPELVGSLREMVQAIDAGDLEGLTRALKAAGLQLDEDLDLETLLGLVGVLLGNAKPEEDEEGVGASEAGRPASTDGRVATGVKLTKSIGNIPVDLLLVGRALGLLDGISKQLDPSIDALGIVAHYA